MREIFDFLFLFVCVDATGVPKWGDKSAGKEDVCGFLCFASRCWVLVCVCDWGLAFFFFSLCVVGESHRYIQYDRRKKEKSRINIYILLDHRSRVS